MRTRSVPFLIMIAVEMLAIALAWIVASVTLACGAEYTLLGADAVGKCERCINRCRKEACATVPSPSPAPTHSPKPPPIQCNLGLGRHTFQLGVPEVICWDEKTPRPMVQFQSSSLGNFACATWEMDFGFPDGSHAYTSNTFGAPTAITPWKGPGRYWLMLKMTSGAPDCGGLNTWVQ